MRVSVEWRDGYRALFLSKDDMLHMFTLLIKVFNKGDYSLSFIRIQIMTNGSESGAFVQTTCFSDCEFSTVVECSLQSRLVACSDLTIFVRTKTPNSVIIVHKALINDSVWGIAILSWRSFPATPLLHTHLSLPFLLTSHSRSFSP